jgi:hypothetical protein
MVAAAPARAYRQHSEVRFSLAVLLRRLLLRPPAPTAHAIHTRLPKRLALAVFSSDALSSTAYATEEILRVLMVYGVTAGATRPALGLSWPIALGIALLLVIVSLSYRQTIHAYPGGASAYLVSKDNLGTIPSLVAGASLLWSYILTVSVSVAAGAAAITSAIPQLQGAAVPLCLGFIALITLANLRGAKESGAVFAIPTYSFVFSMLLMLALGLVKLATGGVPEGPARRVDRGNSDSGDAARTRRDDPGSRFPVRDFARLCLGVRRADRHRGDLRRHPRLQEAGAEKRRDDADDPGRHPDHDVFGDVVPGQPLRDTGHPRRGEGLRDGHLPDRAARLHRRAGLVLLCSDGRRHRDPDRRREHGVPGFPAPCLAAGARQVSAPTAGGPRRPPGLPKWHPDPVLSRRASCGRVPCVGDGPVALFTPSASLPRSACRKGPWCASGCATGDRDGRHR